MIWLVRIICLTIWAIFSIPSYSAIQRWVDEHGVVHYGDRIPPEYLGKASIQLNNQGVRVKEKDRSLTDVERQQAVQIQEQQIQVDHEREEQNRRDRSLMDTYANIDEINRARSRALESIDNAMNVTAVRLAELMKQKTVLDAKLEKNLPQMQFAKLTAEKSTNANEIRHLNDILIKRKQERLQTEQRYTSDFQRYSEIIAAIAAKKKSLLKESSSSSLNSSMDKEVKKNVAPLH
jgi:Domain of unknown function (DUF4124)